MIKVDEIDSEDPAAKLKGLSPEALRGFSETTQDVLNTDHDLDCEDLALELEDQAENSQEQGKGRGGRS